ncbi:hypothetical protein JB92DRAFT_2836248 [Gautieria morchelliformis]|nr:hypothetical protein JB92DRAFT_2836248 [Gautieria morchelliformis]
MTRFETKREDSPRTPPPSTARTFNDCGWDIRVKVAQDGRLRLTYTVRFSRGGQVMRRRSMIAINPPVDVADQVKDIAWTWRVVRSELALQSLHEDLQRENTLLSPFFSCNRTSSSGHQAQGHFNRPATGRSVDPAQWPTCFYILTSQSYSISLR